MDRYIELTGARRNSIVLIDRVGQWIWHRNGFVAGNTRYRCSSYTERRCRASVVRDLHGIYHAYGHHNHEIHQALISRHTFVEWCRERARTTNIRPHAIYLEALRRFPGPPPCQFQEIRATIYRARRETNPRIPVSPEEFAELIESVPRYK
ncbi:hypothetical protein OUZ56_009965 [Daphnia magna]|uniref:FLYWCH-type domain-containing protein n=1 Tax=Daphnia magna TaxID=35525 RepID=A0ABR0AHE8_9CRUS|nr:hypothetical protein OUZ56_009965 [Daphnia magna]